MMKNYLVSLLLLACVTPAALCMDNRRQPVPNRHVKESPEDIFKLLESDRFADPTAMVNMDVFLQRFNRDDLNMAKMVSDQFGTRLTPPLASISFRITPEVIESLVAHGADVNATVYQKDRGSELFKPMSLLSWFVQCYLCLNEQFENIVIPRQIIRQLIARGADAEKCYKECAYDLAHRTCRTELQGALMAHILRAKNDQFSGLVDAIDLGDLEQITTLCTSKQELINHRDEFGFTPLGYALLRSTFTFGKANKAVVLGLLSLGARGQDPLFIHPKYNMPYCKSALDIAAENHWDDVAQLLRAQEQEQLRAQMGADECAICLNAPDENTQLQRLGCGHIFCQKCVQALRNKVCPACREPIR